MRDHRRGRWNVVDDHGHRRDEQAEAENRERDRADREQLNDGVQPRQPVRWLMAGWLMAEGLGQPEVPGVLAADAESDAHHPAGSDEIRVS